MKKISNRGAVGIVVAGFAGLLALLLVLAPKLQVATNNTALGSVALTGEYKATSTREVDGTALAATIGGGTLLRSGAGTLGSVIITGAGAGTLNFFDGTTTLDHADHATTSLTTIPNSAAAGTYTFDVAFKRGLIVVMTGTAPTSTITFRGN